MFCQRTITAKMVMSLVCLLAQRNIHTYEQKQKCSRCASVCLSVIALLMPSCVRLNVTILLSVCMCSAGLLVLDALLRVSVFLFSLSIVSALSRSLCKILLSLLGAFLYSKEVWKNEWRGNWNWRQNILYKENKDEKNSRNDGKPQKDRGVMKMDMQTGKREEEIKRNTPINIFLHSYSVPCVLGILSRKHNEQESE